MVESPTLLRRKTEMLGTLVLPADDMHQAAATTPNLQRRTTEMCGTLVMPAADIHQTAATNEAALEEMRKTVSKSVTVPRRNSEMYGTLVMPAGDKALKSPLVKRRASSWYDPMDEVSAVGRMIAHV